jgi:hypothetical protein
LIDYLSQKLFFSKKAAPSGKEESLEMITEEIPVPKVDPLKAEIHSFLQCVRDRKKALISGLDGKRALGIVLQLIQKIDDLNSKRE